jgi:hypothetical protein
MLFRATEQLAPMSRNVGRRRALHATSRRRQDAPVAKRYGQANEPPPYLGGGKGFGPSTTQQSGSQDVKQLPKIGENLQKDGEREAGEREQDQQGDKSSPESGTQHEAITVQGQSRPATGDPMFDATEGPSKNDKDDKSTDKPADKSAEKATDSLLDTVMDPVKHTPAIRHPPHIDAPRYVHHFDTYSLVRRLQAGDWTKPQAITIMKSMRLLLGDNLEKASQALVSKSDVENETYLFSAACSELRTEVFARRVALHEKMRMERDQLQHEVDILEQRLGQETAAMKDELRGMFDDRKMAVRNEQRYMESKVQELNYKITVNLQADSKSDVEGVRWVLTRRVILTLGIIVMMVVSSLKLYSNSVHEKEQERKRRSKMRNAQSQTDNDDRGRGGNGNGGGNGSGSPVGGLLVSEGDNPAFVSLG